MLYQIIDILIQILYVVNIVFTVLIVFFERKNPSGTWAWLLVAFLIPYFGFFIYLLLGADARRLSVFTEKKTKDLALVEELSALPGLEYQRKKEKYLSQINVLGIQNSEHHNDLITLNSVAGNSPLMRNNTVRIFKSGEEKFDTMIADIEAATSHIHMLYYIIRNDNLGNRVVAALASAAKRGVEVRLMTDGMGSRLSGKSFLRPITDAGGYVAWFLPPLIFRMNYRNHRKICVIDGSKGYIGGLNIGDEYLGQVKKYGKWRDTHIRIEGEAVKELSLRFACDWNFYANDKLPVNDCRKYFPVAPVNDKKGKMIQIVSCGPDTKWSSIQYGYAKMITEAEQSIYIVTPYFCPDDSIFELLKIAALSGLDVRIIIPANPDHPFVYWASMSYLGELISAGVKCYEYLDGFIHSKLIVIDSMVSSTGSANMDIRSFKLNFEVNAFIYDIETAKEFEAQFMEDIEKSNEITLDKYLKRSRIFRIKESVSRLLSPIL